MCQQKQPPVNHCHLWSKQGWRRHVQGKPRTIDLAAVWVNLRQEYLLHGPIQEVGESVAVTL